MAIYVIRKEGPIGPLSIVELRERLKSGSVVETDLVRIDGVRRPTRIADLPGFGVEERGSGMEGVETSALHRGSEEDYYGLLDVDYAPLYRRAAAGLLIDLPLACALPLACVFGGWRADVDGISMAGWALLPVVFALYYAVCEGSPLAATVGKRLLGLRTLDEEGEPLRFGQAAKRSLWRLVSLAPCAFGYAQALFSPRRLALHDRVSRTIVIRDD